jgi:hypothetical protein
MIDYKTHCPICNLEWKKIYGFAKRRFKCHNFDRCNLTLIKAEDDIRIYLLKKFSTTTKDFSLVEIWWIFDNTDFYISEVKINNTYHRLSFMPPFDISEDKLKLYLTFS